MTPEELDEGERLLAAASSSSCLIASIPLKSWLWGNRRALLAAARERDALKGDVELAAGELLVDMRDAQPGTLASRLLLANRLMSRERDTLKAEVERLRTEAESLEPSPFECDSCGHSELRCAGCGVL